jgi:hypothetical protein
MPSRMMHTRPKSCWRHSSLCQLLMALLMMWGRSSGGSYVIFIFLLLSCKQGTQMNESFTKFWI